MWLLGVLKSSLVVKCQQFKENVTLEYMKYVNQDFTRCRFALLFSSSTLIPKVIHQKIAYIVVLKVLPISADIMYLSYLTLSNF